MTTDETRKRLSEAALDLVQKHGAVNVTLDMLCEQLNVPPGSFAYVAGCTFSDFMRELQRFHPGPPLPSKRDRIDAGLLPGHLVNVALELAQSYGYKNVSRSELAEAAGVSRGTTHRAFDNLADLQTAVLAEAVRRGLAPVVAQGLALSDPVALDAPDKLKRAAAAWVRAQ